jgi:hypothetical protein
MERCPDYETLVEYAEGLLPEGDCHDIVRHLKEGCLSCRREVDRVMEITDFVITSLGERHPAGVANIHQELLKRIRECIDEIVTVPMKLHPCTSVPALRSPPDESAGTEEGSFVYGGDRFHVHLRIEETGESGLNIRGRMIPDASGGNDHGVGEVLVFLQSGGQPAGDTRTDRFGRFKFGGITAQERDDLVLKLWPDENKELVIRLDPRPGHK